MWRCVRGCPNERMLLVRIEKAIHANLAEHFEAWTSVRYRCLRSCGHEAGHDRRCTTALRAFAATGRARPAAAQSAGHELGNLGRLVSGAERALRSRALRRRRRWPVDPR